VIQIQAKITHENASTADPLVRDRDRAQEDCVAQGWKESDVHDPAADDPETSLRIETSLLSNGGPENRWRC